MLSLPMETTYVQFELESGGLARIDHVAPGSYRVRLSADGCFREPSLNRYGIVRSGRNTEHFRKAYSGNWVLIEDHEALLRINRQDGTLRFAGHDGDILLESALPPLFDAQGGFGAVFSLKDGERLYGLGDQTRDRLEKSGHRADMWVRSEHSYAPVPFVMSSRGWGLAVNTTWRHTIDLGQIDPKRMAVEGKKGNWDFYFFAGDCLADILDRYTDVAGKPALLPIWAYGLTFVCHELSDARSMIDDALRFRKEGIPCDTIGLDGGWTEIPRDFSIRKKWHPSRFYIPRSAPEGPHTFIGTLLRHGFKLCLVLVCDYDLGIHEERMAVKKERDSGPDSVTGRTGDTGAEQSDEAWYDHLRPFVRQGVASFKLSGSSQVVEHPQRIWGNGMLDEEMHNLYPVLLGKQMHEGFREQTGLRPMIYTTAGYVGVQRFAATWAGAYAEGDATLISMLNHGLTGHSNTSNDMEIFTPAGIHFGFLQAWSQINSWAYFRHPGLLEEPLLRLFVKYAKLRYRMLPYFYTAARTANRTGMPVMRAMVLVYPNDPEAADLKRQYMLGDFLLVAAFTSRVYLPEGEWTDYWTQERHQGPVWIDCTLPEDVGGPLFVKQGAILPEWPDMDYVGQMQIERLTLRLFPYRSSEYVLYEDDGVSYSHENGEFTETFICCQADEFGIDVTIYPRTGSYEGMPKTRSYDLCIRCEEKPLKLNVNGRECAEVRKNRLGRSGKGDSFWYYDRTEAMVRLWGVEERESSLPIRVVVQGAKVAQAGTEKSAAGSSNGRQPQALPTLSEKSLELYLELGDVGKAHAVFEALWQDRLERASLGEAFHEHIHTFTAMLVHLLERLGVSSLDVLGSDAHVLTDSWKGNDIEEALNHLRRVIGQIADYVKVNKHSAIHPLVARTLDIIETELNENLQLHTCAERLYVSPSHLSRLFKKQLGQSFSDYVTERKMQQAKRLLLEGHKVHDVANALGFEDSSYFARVFRKCWGIPPNECRK